MVRITEFNKKPIKMLGNGSLIFETSIGTEFAFGRTVALADTAPADRQVITEHKPKVSIVFSRLATLSIFFNYYNQQPKWNFNTQMLF